MKTLESRRSRPATCCAAVKAGTPVGKQAKGFMDRGELVPDAVVIGVAEERMRQPDAQSGFILDGFPRTAGQAEALDRMLAKLGVSLERCIALQVDEDEIVKRLLKRAQIEGRSDDNEAAIRTRMLVYRENTQPLIDYYREHGVLREVNGLGSIDAVAARIEGALAA
jgi:adenylate kinase